jgi:hypothetical protein
MTGVHADDAAMRRCGDAATGVAYGACQSTDISWPHERAHEIDLDTTENLADRRSLINAYEPVDYRAHSNPSAEWSSQRAAQLSCNWLQLARNSPKLNHHRYFDAAKVRLSTYAPAAARAK